MDEKYGENYLKNKKLKKELAQVNKELKRLKAELASLEQRKVELLDNIEDSSNNYNTYIKEISLNRLRLYPFPYIRTRFYTDTAPSLYAYR